MLLGASADMLSSHPQPGRVREEMALRRVEVLEAQNYAGSVDALEVLHAGVPALLQGTAVDNWPARSWSWGSLREALRSENLTDVMRTDGHLYLVPDTRAALEPLMQYPAWDESSNMSASDFFDEVEAVGLTHTAQTERSVSPDASPTCVSEPVALNSDAASSGREWRRSGQRLVYFGAVPKSLRGALQPEAVVFPAAEDGWQAGGEAGAEAAAEAAVEAAAAGGGVPPPPLETGEGEKTSMWLSTPGVRTHTHFDSDPNFFVQLVGRKRFVLWPPNQTALLCPFPRLHPLWHKSRANFEAPDLSPPCSSYPESEAIATEVAPGDLLYIPPFWWHTVETLSPSLSLTTISRWPQLYIHLNAVYSHEFFFDKLSHRTSRLFALRAFLTQLLRRAAGGGAGSERGLIKALRRQYTGLEHLFERSADDERALCTLDVRGTPTCRSCLANIKFDVTITWDEHLVHLPADVRAVVLPELVEELTQHTLGTRQALPFWETCFNGQPFFLTSRTDEEHRILWEQGPIL